MPERTLRWGTEALWQQLEPLLPGLSVEVVHSTRSTNTALLERARAVPDTSGDSSGDAIVRRSVESGAFGRRAIDLQPCLLIAEHQTAGRGRQGRVWQSAAGASLTFSLAIALAAADWSGLSLAVGVALSEALEHDAPGRHIGLKWPNDLWLIGEDGSGRKLGGVLIETVAAGSQRLAIIGIGLNVLAFAQSEVTTGFATLSEFEPSTDAPTVLAHIAEPLVRALKLFEQAGYAAFAERFDARDVLRGRAVRTTQADVTEGIARGVSPTGALLVQTANGMVAVSSGEVSVRPVGPPSPAS